MTPKFIVVDFAHVNIGLKWCRDGVKDVGTVIREFVYRLAPQDPTVRLRVMVEVRSPNATCEGISEVMLNDSVLENYNGYFQVVGYDTADEANVATVYADYNAENETEY